MKPEIRIFTKDSPCSKADLWRCFHPYRSFATVPIAEAQAIIGANAPRGMEQHKRLQRVEVRGVECYRLTSSGEAWLIAGMLGYAKNHPLEALQINNLPSPTGRMSAPSMPEVQNLPSGRIRRVRA